MTPAVMPISSAAPAGPPAKLTRATAEHQLSEFREVVAGFAERYPESRVLRRGSFDGGEQWLELIRSQTEQWSLDMEPILCDGRHGRMPYGML